MPDRESAILKFAALSVEEITETGQEERRVIQLELRRIERELGLSPKEIITEASVILNKKASM